MGAGAGAVAGIAVASVASVITLGLAAPLFIPVVAGTTAAGAGVGYVSDKLAEGTRMYLYEVVLAQTDEVVFAYHTTRTPHQPGTQVNVYKVKKQWVVKDA